jgi:cytochrome o ubiquinol oxidase subunit 2
MHEMAAIDRKGGLGLAGIDAILPRELAAARPQAVFGAMASYVASLCTPEDPTAGGRPVAASRLDLAPPLRGLGLRPPAALSGPASLTWSPTRAARSDI